MSLNRYGLVGKSLGHSFSQKFFTEKFEREKLNAVYDNFELDEIHQILPLFQQPELKGLNVTIPYKSAVMEYLDEINPEAQSIGAVNTIVVRKGITTGYNTDAYGFQQSIKPFLRNVHQRALILGTGGAAKAVAYVLTNLGVDVAYLTRNPVGRNQFRYEEANEYMMQAFKLVVNTSPIGTAPNYDEMPDIPTNFFSPDHLVIDLIYNPKKTKFLLESQKSGADILNGYSMLQHQALKAWELFNA